MPDEALSEKLSEQSPAAALTGAELAYVVQAGNSRRTTVQAIAAMAPGTNLTYSAPTRTLSSSTGNNAVFPLATTTDPGLMSAADKAAIGTIGTATTVTVAVRNNSGVTIPKGASVYVTGSSGTRVTVALADASLEATAAGTLGLAQAEIPNNADGVVVAVGELAGLNTASLTEGGLIWLSETAGQLTSTRPTQPAHGVVLGYCVKQGSGTSGIVYVKVDNGLELDELHDVLITGAAPAAGAPRPALARHSDGLWRNTALTPADVGADPSGTAATAMAAHVAAADPHPGYLTPTEGNAAYAPLASVHDSVTLAASVADVLGLTGQQLGGVNPGAGDDRILFWDHSAGRLRFLTLGANLGITDTTLNGTGGGGGGGGYPLFTAPTGFNVTGSGTSSITLAFATGYALPTTASQANWDAAYSERLRWDGGATGLNAATARTSLELGSLATQSGTFSGISSGVNTGDQTITLSGDVTGQGTGSFAATLATTAVVAGSYGSATQVATFSVDTKGRLTAAGNVSISIGSTAISDGTAAGRSLFTAANAGAQRTSLGLGDFATATAATPPAIGGTTPAAGTFSILTASNTLTLPSGAPASPTTRNIYAVADTIRYRDSGNTERLLLNATDNLANLANATTARANLGAGTVNSVGLSLPSLFTVTNSPVISSGTLTGTLATQPRNLVFAGPTSGADAAPTMRALVTADLPTTGITPGSYTNVNCTVDATGRITAISNGSGGGGSTPNAYVVGNYICPYPGNMGTGAASVAGSATLVPFIPLVSCTVSDLFGRVVGAVASSLIQLMIYESTGSSPWPTNCVGATAATLSGATSTAIEGSVTPFNLTAGRVYWMVANANAAGITMISAVTASCYTMSIIGASTAATVFTSGTAANIGYSTTITFGTTPSLASASFALNTSARSTIVGFKVSALL